MSKNWKQLKSGNMILGHYDGEVFIPSHLGTKAPHGRSALSGASYLFDIISERIKKKEKRQTLLIDYNFNTINKNYMEKETIEISREAYNSLRDQIYAKENSKKKPGINIKKKWGYTTVYESEKTTLKEAIEEAVEQYANLKDAGLRRTDLRGTNLKKAKLNGANLSEANLKNADLKGIRLQDADLSHADLRGSELEGADLKGADLSHADLRGVELENVFLKNTYLKCTDLRGAIFKNTDLCSIRFHGREGSLRIKANQVDDFLKALGVRVD